MIGPATPLHALSRDASVALLPQETQNLRSCSVVTLGTAANLLWHAACIYIAPLGGAPVESRMDRTAEEKRVLLNEAARPGGSIFLLLKPQFPS